MGNRSRYLVSAASVGAAFVAVRRHRQRRHAPVTVDDAHAPGHQHLAFPAAVEPPPTTRLGRRWRSYHGRGQRLADR